MEQSTFQEVLINNIFAFIAMLIVFVSQIVYDKCKVRQERKRIVKYLINIFDNFITNSKITVKSIDDYICSQKQDFFYSDPIRFVPFNDIKRILDNEKDLFQVLNSAKRKSEDWIIALKELTTDFDFVDGNIAECKRLNEVHINDFSQRSDCFSNLITSIPNVIKQDLMGHIPDALTAHWIHKYLDIQGSESISVIKNSFLDPLSSELIEHLEDPKTFKLAATVREAKICADQIKTINTQYIEVIYSVRQQISRNITSFEKNKLLFMLRTIQ